MSIWLIKTMDEISVQKMLDPINKYYYLSPNRLPGLRNYINIL